MSTQNINLNSVHTVSFNGDPSIIRVDLLKSGTRSTIWEIDYQSASISCTSRTSSPSWQYEMGTFAITRGGTGFSVGEVFDIPLQDPKTFTYNNDDDNEFTYTWPVLLYEQPTFRVTAVSETGGITNGVLVNRGKFQYFGDVENANKNTTRSLGTGTYFGETYRGGQRHFPEAYQIGVGRRLPAGITMTSSYRSGDLSFQMASISIPSGGTGSGFSVGEVFDVPLAASKHIWFRESTDDTTDTWYHTKRHYTDEEVPLTLYSQPTIKVLTVGPLGQILTAKIENAGRFRYYRDATYFYGGWDYPTVGRAGTGTISPDWLDGGSTSSSSLSTLPPTMSESYTFPSRPKFPAAIELGSERIGSWSYIASRQYFKIGGSIGIPSGGAGAGFLVGDVLNVPLPPTKHGWVFVADTDPEEEDRWYHSEAEGLGAISLDNQIQPTIRVTSVGALGQILSAQVQTSGQFTYYREFSSFKAGLTSNSNPAYSRFGTGNAEFAELNTSGTDRYGDYDYLIQETIRETFVFPST